MLLQKLNPENNLIVTDIDDNYLEERLSSSMKENKITSEQWYRKPENWYSLTSFNNPYKTIYSELVLLGKNRAKILNAIGKSTLVFYGVGTGDTEGIMAKWLLDKYNYAEVIGIDAIKTYLESFVQILSNVSHEKPSSELSFLGLNTLFERLERKSLLPENSVFRKNTHICLGNTTGNFPQKMIFTLFRSLMKKDELLILGLHRSNNLKKTLKSYAHPLFSEFIFAPIKHKFPKTSIHDIEWKINPEENSVEAWLGRINIFNSRKYTPMKISELSKKHNFTPVTQFTDKNTLITILKKK